jgi:hypothetical protein
MTRGSIHVWSYPAVGSGKRPDGRRRTSRRRGYDRYRQHRPEYPDARRGDQEIGSALPGFSLNGLRPEDIHVP